MAYIIFMEFVIASQFCQTGGLQNEKKFQGINYGNQTLKGLQGVYSVNPIFYYVK